MLRNLTPLTLFSQPLCEHVANGILLAESRKITAAVYVLADYAITGLRLFLRVYYSAAVYHAFVLDVSQELPMKSEYEHPDIVYPYISVVFAVYRKCRISIRQ